MRVVNTSTAMEIATATTKNANKRLARMKKGLFITFEGGEGCGKTTQVKLLKEYISTLPKKEDFIFLREPGGTPLAEKIRSLILENSQDSPLPMTELLLFCSARVENTYKNILPALKNGKIVIADRFYDSTIAYQGMARNIMPPQKILELTKNIIGDLKPDLTFYLKLSPQEAFERKKQMSQGLDRMENEGLEFHNKVYEGYEYISRIESDRFCVIDAKQSIEEISGIVKEKILEAINKNS